MGTIILTVQSENFRDKSASVSRAFNVEKIVNVYANEMTICSGNSMVSYQENDESPMIITYGVSETVTYINNQLNPDENISYEEVGLSSAQILAAHTTPIALISTPGAGKYISIVSAIVEYTYGSAQYANSRSVQLVTSTTKTVQATAAVALTGAADKVVRFVDVAGEVNADEGISVNLSGAEATGDGTIIVKVKYTIL